MIYKTKHEYYTLERRLGIITKIKHRGYKLTIKELTFYAEDKESIKVVTEETTGTGIKIDACNLEELENKLYEMYPTIHDGLWIFKNKHPDMALDKVYEWGS